MTDWLRYAPADRPEPRERLDGAVDGCTWCGIVAKQHPTKVRGAGHFSTTVRMPPGYVAPSPELVARRQEVRQSGGLPIAEFDESMGRARTDFVRTRCRCGADVVCTPSRADGARCEKCMKTDAETAVETPGYDMQRGGS